MESTTQEGRAKRIQKILTVFLALVLALLVAGYIYYGMQLAKRTAGVSTETGTEATATDKSDSTLSHDEKMAILDTLAKDSTTTVSAAEKEAVLKNLAKDSTTSVMTDEEKQKVLDALSGGR